MQKLFVAFTSYSMRSFFIARSTAAAAAAQYEPPSASTPISTAFGTVCTTHVIIVLDIFFRTGPDSILRQPRLITVVKHGTFAGIIIDEI